jgi:linoleoyl-CoA desaturase
MLRRLTFAGDNEFQAKLRHRVNKYFRETGRPRRDSFRQYFKAAVILLAFVFFYTLLVFLAETWWQAVPLSILLALVAAGIGFNIMHDGGHGACSRFGFVNRFMARCLDVIGGSSYLWHLKHTVLHHSCPNISGYDTDISLGKLARFTPGQPLYAYQRWQHWYVWLMYGALAIKWHFYDDFRALLTGTIGPHRIPRPRNWDLAVLIAYKVIFFSLAFGVPLLIHPLWVVVLCYSLFAVVLGLTLSVVFQLAHCVEEAEFPILSEGATDVDKAWAVHQVETTVDFCRGNRVITWLLGGLNYQIEHHLFPTICHSNYPAISVLVKETCHDFRIPYKEHPTFWAGMRSHFRWLRRMGAQVTVG